MTPSPSPAFPSEAQQAASRLGRETVVMSVRFPKELHERLRHAAFALRVPMSHIVVGGTENALDGWAWVPGDTLPSNPPGEVTQ